MLERVGVTYRVEVPPRRRKVVEHRDRLAPYRGRGTGVNGVEDPAMLPQEQPNSETLTQPEPGEGAASAGAAGNEDSTVRPQEQANLETLTQHDPGEGVASAGADNDIGPDEGSGASLVGTTGRPKRQTRPPVRFKDFSM